MSAMYPSPPWSSARWVSSTLPPTSTVYAPAVSVQAARTAASSPIRRMTSLATPRASTACPPGRSPGDCSTTLTSAPRRCSQWASAGPATLAPDTNTLTLLIVSPVRPSDDRLVSLWVGPDGRLSLRRWATLEFDTHPHADAHHRWSVRRARERRTWRTGDSHEGR